MSQEPKVTRFGADPTVAQELATKAYVDAGGGGGASIIIGGAYQSSTGSNSTLFYFPDGQTLQAQTTETNVATEFSFAWNFKRLTLRVPVNTKSLDGIASMRDDGANITGGVITITAGVTGIFDSGDQTTLVAAGSAIACHLDMAGSGNIFCVFHWEGETI